MATSRSFLQSQVPNLDSQKQDIEDEDYQKTCKKYEEFLQTLPKEKGWWREHVLHFQGFWLPLVGLKGSMLINDHFKFRPTDIILSSFPKCGTTWLRALTFATVHRNSFDFCNNNPLLTTNPQDLVLLLEGYLHRGKGPLIDALPSPRLLSTHLPYSLFPKSITSRFVYICRDPKDVLVSKWHFTRRLRDKELPPISMEEAFELFCRGVSAYGPFWDHVLEYWKASLDSPTNVLFLKYEDVQKEPSACVRKLAGFLETPFSMAEEEKGVVQEIVRLCSFENLSNLEVNKTAQEPRRPSRPVSNPDFFRKGEVGDWKNHLTPHMAELLDQITEEKFKGSGLSFA